MWLLFFAPFDRFSKASKRIDDEYQEKKLTAKNQVQIVTSMAKKL